MNGEYKNQNTTVSGNIVNNDGPMYIGKYVNGNTSRNYFSGNIDEVTIWNDALSAMEVAALYNS